MPHTSHATFDPLQLMRATTDGTRGRDLESSRMLWFNRPLRGNGGRREPALAAGTIEVLMSGIPTAPASSCTD